MGKHIFSCVVADSVPHSNQLSALRINRDTRICSSQSQHFYSKRKTSSFSWKSPCAFNCSPGKSALWEATPVNSRFLLCKDTWAESEIVAAGRQKWYLQVLNLTAITQNQSLMEYKLVLHGIKGPHRIYMEQRFLSLGLLCAQLAHGSLHHVPRAWGAAELKQWAIQMVWMKQRLKGRSQQKQFLLLSLERHAKQPLFSS